MNIRTVLFVLLFAAFLHPVMLVSAVAEEAVYLAPVNPEFIKYSERSNQTALNASLAEHALGYIPSPVDRSHLKGMQIFPIADTGKALAVPSSYDLRSTGKVTAVKNQGSCGCCWAFAAMGSLESNLLTGETWDFSEENLKNRHGFDWAPCSGGNNDMSLAYFARWSGPYRETDDPYNASYTTKLDMILPPSSAAVKHLQQGIVIPARNSSTDNDNIKQAIMTYGAVSSSYYQSTSYYNSTYSSYYCSSCSSTNHLVDIVGWDDNYDKSKFKTTPSANGAFIVRNSWGTDWGEDGYFYVSYYDSTFARSDSMVFNSAQDTTNYGTIYQYDPLGQTWSMGYGSTMAWFANIFTATASQSLSAVGFHTLSANASYEIYVYTGVSSSPVTGTLSGSKTGNITAPGYHTVTLDSAVSLTSGQKFSVAVKMTTPGYDYPIPMEYPTSNYASAATAGAGQSYVGSNGTSWTDLTTLYANTNVCLKAFATAQDTNIYSNSIGSKNSIKVTDMSGALSSSGSSITVSAWDQSGNALAESDSAAALKLYSNGTTTISGTDLAARFPAGTPMLYALSADSSKYIITNVKISSDGSLNVPNGATSGTTKFVTNSVGARNSIKVTDMSGTLSTSGASITVLAWDSNGNAIAESGEALPLKLYSHGTTTITGPELQARFPGAIPMSYEFTVDSSQYVMTNVKSSTDGSINIPYSYTSGTTNFVANSIGSRNTIKISDVSGLLSSSGASITVSAWDVNGNVLAESVSASPLKLYSRGTTTISGSALQARFPGGTPMAYEFTVNSTKYIITNTKSSTDGTINIPAVFTYGTTTYETNDISSRSNVKITDASGSLSSSGASITVAAWDVNGASIPESGSAVSLLLYNHGTTTISGTDLMARFPGGTPVLYEFTIGSTQYVVTNVTANTDNTVTIPSVYTYGVAGGI